MGKACLAVQSHPRLHRAMEQPDIRLRRKQAAGPWGPQLWAHAGKRLCAEGACGSCRKSHIGIPGAFVRPFGGHWLVLGGIQKINCEWTWAKLSRSTLRAWLVLLGRGWLCGGHSRPPHLAALSPGRCICVHSSVFTHVDSDTHTLYIIRYICRNVPLPLNRINEFYPSWSHKNK